MRRDRMRGSAIAELVPSIVLLALTFFPMIDLLGLSFSFGCGWYLNFLQVREASVTAKVRGGNLLNADEVAASVCQIEQQWAATGLGQFLHQWHVQQSCSLADANGDTTLQLIQVSTSLSVSPLLQVPFVGPIPGLNAPVNFTFSAQRPVENVG